MEKHDQTNHPRLLVVLVVAAVVVLETSSPTTAQKSLNAKFPKPDFSEMEEHWEVVSYEFDYTYADSRVPQLRVVAKKKQDKVLYRFDANYYDADDVKVIPGGPLWFDSPTGKYAKVGEPVRASAIAPFMDKMKTVKKIKITVSDAN